MLPPRPGALARTWSRLSSRSSWLPRVVPFSNGRSAEAMERQYLVPTFSGDGSKCNLYDSNGNEYVDWAAGIAVNSLGHSDHEWADTVSQQARTLAHVGNLFHTWEPLELAKSLVESTRYFHKVFLCNSGTEANEAALKFARKHALVEAQRKLGGSSAALPPAFQDFGCKADPPQSCYTTDGSCGCWPQCSSNDLRHLLRTEFIAFKGSFHGRTMGALAVTHKPQIRQPFAPLPGDVKFARYNNLNDVKKYITSKTAAVIVEPIQGEGGLTPADPAFITDLRELTRHHGVLLIMDEVQTGLGRSGRLYAHESYNVVPDMMTLAKPLAGGLPIGAVLVTDDVSNCIKPGDHGSTYAGNPLVTKAAQLVFKRISNPAFLEQTRVRGRQLISGLKALQRKHPQVIRDIRTTLDGGLFVGVDIGVNPKPVIQAALKKGLVLISCGDTVIRICPPLIISAGEIDFGLRVLDEVLAHGNK